MSERGAGGRAGGFAEEVADSAPDVFLSKDGVRCPGPGSLGRSEAGQPGAFSTLRVHSELS